MQLAQADFCLDLQLLILLARNGVVELQSLDVLELPAGELVLLRKALDLQFRRLELHLAEPYVFRQLAVDVKKCRLFLIILDLPILLGRLDLLVNDIDLAQPFVITVEVGEGLPGFDRVADFGFLREAERP